MFKHYFTIAIRNLRRNKYTTLLNIFCLALGISSFVSAFVIVSYLESFDTHFKNAKRIAYIAQESVYADSDKSAVYNSTSNPVAKYLRVDFPELEAVARSTFQSPSVISYEDNPVIRPVHYVEPDFLRIFDFTYVTGEVEGALDRPNSAVITRKAAESVFGSIDIIGKSLLIQNKYPITIRSVIEEISEPSHLADPLFMEGHFELLISMDVFDTMMRSEKPELAEFLLDKDAWMSYSKRTYALLPEDGSMNMDQFNQHLTGFGERHIPKEQGAARFTATNIKTMATDIFNLVLLGGDAGISVTTILLLLAGLVLTVACLNFNNLATVQLVGRSKEFAMRKILGAQHAELCRQYLFETLLISFIAVLISVAGIDLILRVINMNMEVDIRALWIIDIRFLLFLVSVMVLVSLMIGFYPALVLYRLRPVSILNSSVLKVGSNTIRTVLIGSQYFCASFLLIVAIVMYLQHSFIKDQSLGMFNDPLIILLPDLEYANIEQDTFIQRMQLNSNIKGMTGVDYLPWGQGKTVSDYQKTKRASISSLKVQRRFISHDYFKTFKINLISGRFFSREYGNDIAPVTNFDTNFPTSISHNIIIDRTAAKLFGWVNPEEALGKTIYRKDFNTTIIDYPSLTIVGVIEDTPMRLRNTKFEKGIIYYYQPEFAQIPIVKISIEEIQDTLAYIDETWNELAPSTPLLRRFMDEMFEQSYKLFDSIFKAITGLVIFAFIIASMGLIGMANYIAQKRAHEIGIRKTLGASVRQIVTLILTDFSQPIIIANIIAWPFAYYALQSYLSLFIEPMTLSIFPFISSLVITLFISLVCVGGRAFNAASVNPAHVLRYE